MKVAVIALALFLFVPGAAESQWHMGFDLSKLWREGGYVILLRHAEAPGFGDPDNFRIGDCSTQRNLNDRGRDNARYIGDVLRQIGLNPGNTVLYTSQWCRCRETATLLGLGQPKDFDGLNSFFEMHDNRAPNLAKVRALFKSLPTDGKPVIMVTHQVTITALTGDGLASGEGRILKLDGTEQPRLVSKLRLRRSNDFRTGVTSDTGVARPLQ